MSRLLVLGLGNPLRGDDGIGAAVLEALERAALPPDVTLLDGGTAGLETILLMQGYERVIIVDAADMNAVPGTWQHFSVNDISLQSGDFASRVTVHYAGLAEALLLGDALGVLPPQIDIFGVQPQEIGWEIGLSDPVRRTVPVLAWAVYRAVMRALDAAPLPPATMHRQLTDEPVAFALGV